MAFEVASLEQRRFFNRISLKIALFVAIGIELALCIVGVFAEIWHGTKMDLLFQVLEAAACVSVFYAVHKGEEKYLFVYLGYNLFDIIFFELATLPWLAVEVRKVDITLGNMTLATYVNDVEGHELRSFLTTFTAISNGYLLFAGLAWWLVFTAYKEMSKAANRSFVHQAFQNPSNGSATATPKISAVLNSNGLGGNGASVSMGSSITDLVEEMAECV